MVPLSSIVLLCLLETVYSLVSVKRGDELVIP